MNRPYIFCHMMTSLDGKIMGKYMETPEGEAAGNVFYNICFGKAPYYKHQGWLSGRVTTDDNFTFYKKPELDENAPAVPDGDYVAKKAGMYYVSVDPSGKLGISYIIAGDDALDYELALTKLKELFGIETLMLGGGAALNCSFLQAGMCDEVSVVVAAAADGSPMTQTLFMTREGLSDDTPIGFALQEAKAMDGGSVWLRYMVKHKEN